jgi:hypothetical protein
MLAALATVIAAFPQNPSSADPKPYIAMFGTGFLVAVFGHIFKVKLMVAVGILLIFMAAVVLPLIHQLNA